jgi:hypothetical protein
MLSPGQFHKMVPKDPIANLLFRQKLLERARNNPKLQQGIREACQVDILFWINTFVWQYNPQKADGLQPGPFITWPVQDMVLMKEPDEKTPNQAGILWCMENNQSLLLEKSRDMGASWLCLLAFDWRFLFHKWMKFLCISRSEEAVEKTGDTDSLFWKLDWVHNYLPNWLLPRHGVERSRCYFGNKDLGSSITGQASTGLAGVGGRATAMFIDEFSVIRQDTEVRAFSASTTNCRIFNGTHRGLDTEMYRISKQPEIKKLTIHWTQHPEKVAGLYRSQPVPDPIDKKFHYPLNFLFQRDGKPSGGPFPGLRSPWYDKKCAQIGNEMRIAMDLDINPERSVSGYFDALLIHNLIREHCQPPWWEGDLIYDRDTGKPDRFVKRSGGRVKLWCPLDVGGRPPVDKYGAGLDPSTGTGASNTCLSLASATTGEKVLEIADPSLGTVEAAEFFHAVFMMFLDKHGDPPLVGWQIAGPGAKFKQRLCDELGYMRVYRRVTDPFVMFAKDSDKVGLDATVKTTRPMLDDYAESLRKREFLNRSEMAMKEALAWKYNDKGEPEWAGSIPDDPSGARDNHGDRSMSDIICNKMIRVIGAYKAPDKPQGPAILSPAWRYERYEKMRRYEDEEIEA